MALPEKPPTEGQKNFERNFGADQSALAAQRLEAQKRRIAEKNAVRKDVKEFMSDPDKAKAEEDRKKHKELGL